MQWQSSCLQCIVCALAQALLDVGPNVGTIHANSAWNVKD